MEGPASNKERHPLFDPATANAGNDNIMRTVRQYVSLGGIALLLAVTSAFAQKIKSDCENSGKNYLLKHQAPDDQARIDNVLVGSLSRANDCLSPGLLCADGQARKIRSEYGNQPYRFSLRERRPAIQSLERKFQ
jgi:hypothetical protein